MRDFYVFDIPIYIRPRDKYYQDMEYAAIRHLRKLFPSSVEFPREQFPDQCERIEQEFRRDFGGSWQFSQIVGWLRLYVEGSQIQAHLWWAEARRLQTRTRRTFYLPTTSNVLASQLMPEDDSANIFIKTLAEIEALSKGNKYRGRFFDLTVFKNLGPFIDWRGLLDPVARRSLTDAPQASH